MSALRIGTPMKVVIGKCGESEHILEQRITEKNDHISSIIVNQVDQIIVPLVEHLLGDNHPAQYLAFK